MAEKNKKLVSTKTLSLLITIVHKEKMEYYADLLQQFEINMQMIAIGNGTTKTAVYVDEVGTKAIIFSVIADDKIKQAMDLLDDKFKTIKNGKGVAFTIPFTKVMGVQLFNFLSNNMSTII